MQQIQELQKSIATNRQIMLDNLHNPTVVDHLLNKIELQETHLRNLKKEHKPIQSALIAGDDGALLLATEHHEGAYYLAQRYRELMARVGDQSIKETPNSVLEELNSVREQLIKGEEDGEF